MWLLTHLTVLGEVGLLSGLVPRSWLLVSVLSFFEQSTLFMCIFIVSMVLIFLVCILVL
jgi:hypothetical protein